MKVWIVRGNEGIWGVFAKEEDANEAKKVANWEAEMEGRRGGYIVDEQEVK